MRCISHPFLEGYLIGREVDHGEVAVILETEDQIVEQMEQLADVGLKLDAGEMNEAETAAFFAFFYF